MKIAIPVNDDSGLGSKLSANFSQCKFFLIVSLDNGKVGTYNAIPKEVPARLKGVRGAEAFMLSGKGVEAAIVDRIVEKDRLSFVGNNIRVFIGATGTAEDALKQYAGGKLTESSGCKKDPNACDCC